MDATGDGVHERDPNDERRKPAARGCHRAGEHGCWRGCGWELRFLGTTRLPRAYDQRLRSHDANHDDGDIAVRFNRDFLLDRCRVGILTYCQRTDHEHGCDWHGSPLDHQHDGSAEPERAATRWTGGAKRARLSV